jgi:hypothetical protein
VKSLWKCLKVYTYSSSLAYDIEPCYWVSNSRRFGSAFFIRRSSPDEETITLSRNVSYQLCNHVTSYPRRAKISTAQLRKSRQTGSVHITQRNAHLCHHCCCGKATRITYFECVSVALGIHMRCPCAILSSVAWPVVQRFPRYLLHGTINGKKSSNMKCVSIFSTTFAWSIFHSKKSWARYDKKCTLTFL